MLKYPSESARSGLIRIMLHIVDENVVVMNVGCIDI
jgi:hypothetical protein